MNLEERKLKKRMISLLLCLCMVFSLLPTVVLAEGESVESNQTSGEVCQGVTWEYDTKSKTLTVSGSGLITLDDTSGNTHPWDAFKAEIEHLVIDDGITGTGSIKVFAELSALRTVQFPSTLKTLATGTFATDTALSSVVLPKTIESIGSVVFSMCTGLTSLTIQNRTMTVPAEEHWSSDNRKAPDGLTVYGYKWKSDEPKDGTNLTDFYRYVQWQNENNGGSIQFVALDDTEAAKGGLIKNAEGSDSQIYWAFNEDTKTLTVSGTGDINWDDSPDCYKGGENPPWNKYKGQIENLVIDEGITGTSKIKIFAGLANLKSIQFPSTFKRLYSGAFASCSKLESVTLPEQLVSMGDVVFSNCTNLKTLVVKNQNLTTPTKGHWSTNLTGDSNNPVYKLPADLTVYGYKWKSDNKVDENLTGIYQYVQWQNENNTNGTIQFVAFDDDDAPASSGLIVGSDDIFWSFDSNTKTLTVSGEGNITWDAKLYKAGDNPPWATFIPQIEKLVIGEGITGSSETKLFANLTCLKQISFPSTFTSMGDGTFATASALENVVIPATVTKMGPVVFSACDSLKSLTVLNRTMRIINAESDWTTAGRPAPQNLTVYGYKWKSDDKKSDENLTDIYKYVQYNNAQGGKITFVAQDESDWMPIDATGISWRYDAATKTLYLMGSGEIKLVGEQYKAGDNPPWSAHFSQVENLVIGEGITGTGTLKIFSSLTKLQNVSFPSTFKKLDTGTFATCSSLERIVLPETISSMGSVVFSRCNAMTSLVVKNRNLSVPVETEWSSDKTIPQNLTVYGYRYTDDTRATETKLYQYVQWQNKNYSGTINFVAFDDPNATAGQIGNSDTYWRYDPNTTTLFITGKGMIPGGSSGNYPWQAYADEITNLVIGDGVTGTEATKALAELYKLRSITFGKDFAILGAGAFANIQTLTQLTLPETVTTFGSYPFSGCNGMTELRVECRNIQVANVNSYWNGSETQPLPKNLTVYGYRYTAKGGTEETAFYKYITNEKNKGIKFVDLDAEADLLGDIRWNYDSSAKKLTISGKGEIPAVREGVAWSRYASEIEEIEIEKGVTSIAAGAFTGMPKLKTVTINRTVTNIDAGAFDKPYSFMIKAKRNSAAKIFAEANNINFEEIVTANILFIGNSYTEDAREYLRYVFNQYNFQADIHFGHLFSGGKTLAYYANTARQETNNSDVYGNGTLDTESPRSQETGEGGNTYTNSLTYYTWDNNQTTFASQGTKSIAYAMNDQDWDIVIIQGHDIEQADGDPSNKNFKTNLEYLTNYIKSFDSTVEIGWYMTWRRNGGEGLTRLQAYWRTMQKTVEKNKNVSFIVPIGTAVENARGTYINQFNYRPESQSNIAKVNLLTGQSIGSTMTPDNNNGIQRDETHMSAVVGRFLAGYTMGEMLVKHINGLGGAQFTNKRPIEQIYSYDPNIGLLPAEYVQTIKACAEAAMGNPYEVTSLTDHETDPVQTVKTQVESADFTNTEWSTTAIQAKVADVLAQKPGAKVTGVSITDNTATVTLRYGYSTIDAHCEKNIEPPLQVSITAVGNASPLFLGDTVTVTVKCGDADADVNVISTSDAFTQQDDAPTMNTDADGNAVYTFTFKVRKITAAFVNATFTANAKTDADVTASAQTTLGMNLRNRIHLKLKDGDKTAITDATVKLQSNYDASNQKPMSYDASAEEYRNADWDVSNKDYGTIVVTLADGRTATLTTDKNGSDILTKLQEGTEEIYCEYTFPAYKVTGKLFFNGEPVLYDGHNQTTHTVSGKFGTPIPYSDLEAWAKEYVQNTLDKDNNPTTVDVEIKKDGGTVATVETNFGEAGKLENYVYVNATPSYTVTFMNGEEEFFKREVPYDANTPVPAENPTREGYEFLGWAEVVGDELKPVTDKVTRTVTYQAQWKLNTYIIASTLRINGNEPVKETGKTYSWSHRYGGDYGVTIDYTEMFKALKDKTLEVDAANEPYDAEIKLCFPGSKDRLFNKEILTYGQEGGGWNPGVKNTAYIWGYATTSYEVTFNSDGGSAVNTQIVKYGEKAVKPEDPTMKGYNFLGWFDKNGNPFDFDTEITHKTELKAQWEKKTFTVKYYLPDETGAWVEKKMDTVDSVDYATYSLWTPNAEDGYEFSGWYQKTADIGVKAKVEKLYMAKEWKLYGKFTPIEYTIQYVYNDGKATSTNPTTYTVESDTITLADATGADWGKTFLEWHDENGQKITEIPTGSTGDRVITAYWNWPVHLHYLDKDNNEIESATLYVSELEPGACVLPTGEKTGYDFDGWYEAKKDIGTASHKLNALSIAKKWELYGRYTAKTDVSYTVKYLREGDNKVLAPEKVVTDQTFDTEVTEQAADVVGYTPDAPSKTMILDEYNKVLTFSYSANTYRYEIHYFLQEPDGSYMEKEVDTTPTGVFDTTVTITPDPNRYGAHYSYNSVKSVVSGVVTVDDPATILKLNVYYDLDFHTLTFDTMGGSRIDPVTVRHGNAVAKPKDPVNGGYIFDGWYTDKTYRTPYNFATVLTQDTTIYAKWFLIALPGVTVKKTTPKLNTSDHFAYVQGYPDGTVKPTGNITRAETAAILFRLMDDTSRNNYYSTKSGFRDVAAGSWYNTYVATLNNAGVITDSSNGYFRPNEAITRAELAAMLAQFADTKSAPNYFTDVTANYWAANAIAVCAKLGWINGYPDGTFRPDHTVTRAEMMAMINRALERTPKSAADLLAGMKVWSDNANVNAWYYLDVQEATNSHTYTKSGSHETWKKLR